MTETELEVYRSQFINDYAADVAEAYKLDGDGARRFATHAFDSNLKDGLSTVGHFLFRLCDKEKPVGHLWYTENEGEIFIMDLFIEEGYRQKGHATETLKKLEEEARSRGIGKLSLYVFSFNNQALRLYEKQDFKPVRLYMEKLLS